MDWDKLQKLLENLPEDGYVEITQRIVTIETTVETIPETIEKTQKVVDLRPTDWYLTATSQQTGEDENG